VRLPEEAGGQPPDWEISEALTHWTTYGEAVNLAGARALLEGYRSVADGLPPLHLGSFRGTATGLLNYVAGEIDRR